MLTGWFSVPIQFRVQARRDEDRQGVQAEMSQARRVPGQSSAGGDGRSKIYHEKAGWIYLKYI